MQDRTQRENRVLTETMQRECAAAHKALDVEVGPRAAIARTERTRALASAGPQWTRTRQRLLDGHAIWGLDYEEMQEAAARRRPSLLGEAAEGEAEAEAEGTPPTLGKLRLCDWFDMRGRHMLLVPEAAPEPEEEQRKDKDEAPAKPEEAARPEEEAAASPSASPNEPGRMPSAAAKKPSEESAAPVAVEAPRLLGLGMARQASGVLAPRSRESRASWPTGGERIVGGQGGRGRRGRGGGGGRGGGRARRVERLDRARGMLFNSEAELVRPYAVIPGRLYLSATHLRFVGAPSLLNNGGEGCSQLLEGDWSAAISKDSALIWPLGAVKQLHRRRCMMAHTAIELFRDDGDTLLLNLPDKRLRCACGAGSSASARSSTATATTTAPPSARCSTSCRRRGSGAR